VNLRTSTANLARGARSVPLQEPTETIKQAVSPANSLQPGHGEELFQHSHRELGNDCLAGWSVDSEVTRADIARQHWDRGMLSASGRSDDEPIEFPWDNRADGVGGVVAFAATAFSLMALGLHFHNNYEYYGIHYPYLVWGLVAIGFLAPGVYVWKHAIYELPSQFSLRTLLIAATIIAIVLGLAVLLYRS
jgi:hypothetical protein